MRHAVCRMKKEPAVNRLSGLYDDNRPGEFIFDGSPGF